MTRHLFSSIDYFFRPNNPLDMAMEEPTLFLKTGKSTRALENKEDSPGTFDRHRPTDPHATQHMQGKTFRRPRSHTK